MSEQTITARIELRYNPHILGVTGYDALRKRISDWRSLIRQRATRVHRDILDLIDSTIAENADDVRIVSIKALIENRKVVLRAVVDVTYIRPDKASWRFKEDDVSYFKDPLAFTNEALQALDESFAINAFDITASRVKFFI